MYGETCLTYFKFKNSYISGMDLDLVSRSRIRDISWFSRSRISYFKNRFATSLVHTMKEKISRFGIVRIRVFLRFRFLAFCILKIFLILVNRFATSWYKYIVCTRDVANQFSKSKKRESETSKTREFSQCEIEIIPAI